MHISFVSLVYFHPSFVASFSPPSPIEHVFSPLLLPVTLPITQLYALWTQQVARAKIITHHSRPSSSPSRSTRVLLWELRWMGSFLFLLGSWVIRLWTQRCWWSYVYIYTLLSNNIWWSWRDRRQQTGRKLDHNWEAEMGHFYYSNLTILLSLQLAPPLRVRGCLCETIISATLLRLARVRISVDSWTTWAWTVLVRFFLKPTTDQSCYTPGMLNPQIGRQNFPTLKFSRTDCRTWVYTDFGTLSSALIGPGVNLLSILRDNCISLGTKKP